MLKNTFIFSICCAAFFFVTQAIGGVNMKEGLWEITSNLEIVGMGMHMPPTTYTQCLTKNDMVPKDQEESQCRITDQKVSGNTVTWSMQCTGEGSMSMVGKITYSGNTLQGTTTMTADNPGGPMKMINTISGKRIGECK